MIGGSTILWLVLVVVGFYVLFFVIPTPPVVRNILAIVLAIVLFAILLNALGVFAL